MQAALSRLIWAPIAKALESSKTWTLILGLTATFLAKYGIQVSDSTSNLIAAGFAALLGAQALNDHGKAAAQINQQTSMMVLLPAKAVPSDLAAKNPQAGFARIGVMVSAAMFATAIYFGAMQASCNGVTPVPVADVIDCAKLEGTTDWSTVLAKLTPDLGNWTAMLADVAELAPKFAVNVAYCVGEELIAQYLSTAHTDQVSSTWSAHDLAEKIRTNASHGGKSTTFHTSHGDI